jgi:hypothetical protein
MKVIFLDIDGVLNRGGFSSVAQSSSFDGAAVQRLNGVLAATGARLVLSSSWRYVILDGTMNLAGFEFLMRTHGLAKGALFDHTCADEVIAERGAQIRRWLTEHPVEAWAAVDDQRLQLGRGEEWRHVRTDPTRGLTDEDAARLAAILDASQA